MIIFTGFINFVSLIASGAAGCAAWSRCRAPDRGRRRSRPLSERARELEAEGLERDDC